MEISNITNVQKWVIPSNKVVFSSNLINIFQDIKTDCVIKRKIPLAWAEITVEITKKKKKKKMGDSL